jgi:uncharacterized damage-inducible protein DinB
MLRTGRKLLLMKRSLEDYRKGGVGALMDEYERAAAELKTVLQAVGEDDYVRIADPETKDEDCRSMQTILNHVIHAGYSYANGIRRATSGNAVPREEVPVDFREIGDEIDKMLAYTVETLDDKWELSYDEIDKIIIKSPSGFTETLEQLLEHAIVHVLRHRRQIDKFLLKFEG